MVEDAIVELLESGVGFGVDLFSRLTVVHLEDGQFAVWVWKTPPCYNIEKEYCFASARSAAQCFLRLRSEMQLGYDFE